MADSGWWWGGGVSRGVSGMLTLAQFLPFTFPQDKKREMGGIQLQTPRTLFFFMLRQNSSIFLFASVELGGAGIVFSRLLNVRIMDNFTLS